MSLTCVTAQGRQIETPLAALLTADLRETVRLEANQWIKRLRLVRYGADTMRDRFRYRDDSLWWFTELYLHKMKRIDTAVETVLALEAARAQHAAVRFIVDSSDVVVHDVAVAFGRAHGVAIDLLRGPVKDATPGWPGYLVGLTARLSRLRPARAPLLRRRPAIAAFVHTAFWRTADPQQESYIGPVLDALVTRSAPDAVGFVGLGPRRNFRTRRWWDPVTSAPGGARSPVTPIERLAPRRALDESLGLWRRRRELSLALTSGDDIRAAATFRGCDLWPVLSRELHAVALVQWPWSARAMDEAGAAIDALEPSVVLTYAEAGGWGRALMLEARRRGVRSAGLQHGFIYRHWLNYLHEPDEMAPRAGDRGFPRPDRTLLFDRYAAEHLSTAGHFPASALAVTGSARLEDLTTRLAALRPDRERIRRQLGVGTDQAHAVLAAKFTEIQGDLPALVAAVAALPQMHLTIKTHPAEIAAVYAPFVAGRTNVSIAPPETGLADVLAAADGVVTMNSTVAIDGLVLGIPALVIGLPNNLSPLVAAGVMLGADGPDEIERALKALLYDRQVRQGLAMATEGFVARFGLRPDPGAAARAADEILALTTTTEG